jgi:hypothetical protein
MAQVQRAGGVGRDEFAHQLAAMCRAQAELGAVGQHLGHHGLPRGRLQPQVDEAGAGDLQRVHPLRHRGLRLQRGHQGGGQFARVALLRLGQGHGRGDGEIAMRGLLGGFEGRAVGRTGRHLGHGVGKGGEQGLLGLDHGP